jgi:hypothetical protein
MVVAVETVTGGVSAPADVANFATDGTTLSATLRLTSGLGIYWNAGQSEDSVTCTVIYSDAHTSPGGPNDDLVLVAGRSVAAGGGSGVIRLDKKGGTAAGGTLKCSQVDLTSNGNTVSGKGHILSPATGVRFQLDDTPLNYAPILCSAIYTHTPDTVAGHTAGFWHTSDDRLKFNERNLTNCLEIIDKLSPEIYDKGLNPENRHIEIGFIAQEVEEIPELSHCVSTLDTRHYQKDDNGEDTDVVLSGYEDLKYIDYTQIHTVSVGAIQELYKLVKDLQNTVAQLKAAA